MSDPALSNDATMFAFDDWTFDPKSGELTKSGRPVPLQDLPARLLEALLEAKGHVVTREELIARLWPTGVIDFETGVNTAARKLRTALSDSAEAPRYIETVPRRGYRFIGQIVLAHEPPKSPSGDNATAIGGARHTRALIAAGTLLLIVAAVWFTSVRDASVPRSAIEQPSEALRLAILPLENLSPDPANAFFADGLHEEILSALASRARDLEVLSRTTMMSYRTTGKSTKGIAQELGATHVLAGSLRREQQTVRLTLQLIDARTDVQLWAESFDRQLVDAMSLQSEVASNVAAQLAVKFSGNITALPVSQHSDAYDAFLKARLGLSTVGAQRSLDVQLKALRYLDAAIALDPSFAAAYLQRARVRLWQLFSGRDVSDATVHALQTDLSSARRLLGDSPPLLISEARYALLVEFDSARAAKLMRLAQSMNPNSVDVELEFARVLSAELKPDEARVHFERAVQLDPGNPDVAADWATFLKLAGKAGESLKVSRDFDARFPGRITYGRRLFGFTGQTERLERELHDLAATADAGAQLGTRFDLLLYKRQFDALKPLLAATELDSLPQVSFSGLTIPAVGRKPVAELRGWACLLEQDALCAAQEGHRVLEFVQSEPLTRWNRWYLRLLAAEGALFTGDAAKAIAETHAALALMPAKVHVGIERHGPALAARVLAWAGAHDEAITLLELRLRQFPSMSPAEVTRDPLYSIPLESNSRYRALAKSLESQIAENLRLQP